MIVPPAHPSPLLAVPLVPTLFSLLQALRELLPAGLRFPHTLIYPYFCNHECWAEGANRPEGPHTCYCFCGYWVGRLV
jgi:hypothetical protein